MICSLIGLLALCVMMGLAMIAFTLIVRYTPLAHHPRTASEVQFFRMTLMVGLVLFGLSLAALFLLPVERCI